MPRRNGGPRLRWLKKRRCYYINWTECGRSRERSTGTADREQAEAFFAEWMLARGRCNRPSDPSAVLVTDLLNQYSEAREKKVAAPDRIGYAVAALTDFWENRTIADVTPQTCGRYLETRRCSAGTVRRELGVLRAAINLAHRSGIITRPVQVELPLPPESRARWLTRQEAARLIRAARTPQAGLYMPLFILIGLYTGRRKEAILSLRWHQVDLQTRRIDFEIRGRIKTKKRRGVISIPNRLLPHLTRARRRGTEMGYVLHINSRRIKDVQIGFRAAARRAGLEDVSPHTLRHTAATWLMQKGVDPWQASGFLAMSLDSLLKTYGHHHPDYMLEAANKIGERPQNVRVMR